MSKMHSTSLFSTPWPFWTGISSQVNKNDDEKTLFGLIGKLAVPLHMKQFVSANWKVILEKKQENSNKNQILSMPVGMASNFRPPWPQM